MFLNNTSILHWSYSLLMAFFRVHTSSFIQVNGSRDFTRYKKESVVFNYATTRGTGKYCNDWLDRPRQKRQMQIERNDAGWPKTVALCEYHK